MKKNLMTAFAAICFVSLFGFMSCSDAVVNDGSHIRSFVGTSGNGDTDSGESGGVVPFSMYKDIMDMQIWGDYNAGCETSVMDGALVIEQTGDWYGIAICSDKAGNDKSAAAAIYDMSQIATITFEAKSEPSGTKLAFSACTEDAVTYELTDEYQEFEYDMSKSKHAKTGNHYCMVSLVQNELKSGVTHYVKNISFFDVSGNEIIPALNQ